MRTDRPPGRPQGMPEHSSPSSSTSLLSSHATHSHAASLHFSSSSWTFSSICPISVGATQVGASDGASGVQPSLSWGDGGRGHSPDKDGDLSRGSLRRCVRKLPHSTSVDSFNHLGITEAREQWGSFLKPRQDVGRTCKSLPRLKWESNRQPSLFSLAVPPLHCLPLHL